MVWPVSYEDNRDEDKVLSGHGHRLLEFSDQQVAETREVSESIYIDLDQDGNLVSMTAEHAAETARLPEVAVEEVTAAD